MNALEKVVDVLLCIGILFLMPLLYFDSQKGTLQAVLAGHTAEAFLDRISVEGEITIHGWAQLEEMLHGLGCRQYEIQREYYLYEPEEEGAVSEAVYRTEMEKLMETLELRGSIPFRKGDTLRLWIYCGDVPALYSTTIRAGGEGR